MGVSQLGSIRTVGPNRLCKAKIAEPDLWWVRLGQQHVVQLDVPAWHTMGFSFTVHQCASVMDMLHVIGMINLRFL